MELNVDGNTVKCKTRLGDEEKPLPALLTVERICELRFPSIFSKEGEVTVLDNSSVGADISLCGLKGSPTKVLKTFESERGKRKCEFISLSEIDALLETLIKKEKKGAIIPQNDVKLKSVWAIGREVEKEAYAIADEVVFIDERNPFKIAQMALEQKPEVILWNADIWGRRTAPIVAAILKTGLCADCTALETDGQKLYMYRPALSGNIIAKIECRTYPQMATVRTASEFSDIIVSGGKGVSEKADKLKAFADKYNAEICASRGLVDMGKAPYSAQVGLTGKNVSPKVYVAIGISGAVHHTCAIENADTVIAINPDKDARIFEYADYGIVAEF